MNQEPFDVTKFSFSLSGPKQFTIQKDLKTPGWASLPGDWRLALKLHFREPVKVKTILSPHYSHCEIIFPPKDFIYFQREGKTGRKRGRETSMCERYINQSSLTGDMACNPGTHPDWASNQRPFGSQASTQSTEPHQPEHHEIFWLGHPKHSKTRESTRCPSEDTEWRHWILEIQDHEWDVVPRKLQDNPFSFSSSFSIVKEPWPSTIILHATQTES